eukprot:7503063-Pyramimonas_sp.AAC.1
MALKPPLPGPPPTGPIGYASDCGGLDAGAFALRHIPLQAPLRLRGGSSAQANLDGHPAARQHSLRRCG